MNDKDQSIAAADRPHRQNGDHTSHTEEVPRSFWARLRAKLTGKAPSLREDLQVALDDNNHTEGDGAFSAGEKALIQNVLNLAHTRVEDVMVPRADIEACEDNASMSYLIARFREAGHSRLPIYGDNLDNIIGMIHIKDLLLSLAEPQNEAEKPDQPEKLKSPLLRTQISKQRKMVRDVLFVPPSMPVATLLQRMQTTRVHMAIVVDEYGGTDGLVTIEDLLEAVVGDIEDEHDEAEVSHVRRVDENTVIADARVELEDLAEELGPNFQPGEAANEVDTLGGLIINLVDRVPVRGEVIAKVRGFEFEILQADPRRVKKIKITRRRRGLRGRGRSTTMGEYATTTQHIDATRARRSKTPEASNDPEKEKASAAG
ncbi:hemolysin family protein [Maritalea myrionectae]|uniref:Magnesium and cobalt efflux protein CorC n=1 Tax=Maritalea myrionectae TaxID=454601 RepID=A0A2R4M9Q9_9HYPH|nr:hemolysin family protein [Maritalea myrionectae]AVX02760.1 magnesium and cobalt efflux protein CorC [Maritalea myrionectae]